MTTPVLGAPELTEGQVAPETTVNEQIRWMEQGAHAFSIKDKDLTAAPGAPADGDAYIVAAGATGTWSGKDGKIAFRMSTGWLYITPKEGMIAWAQDEDAPYYYTGAAWAALTAAVLGGVLASTFTEQVQDIVGALIAAGNGVAVVYDDAGNAMAISLTGTGVTTQSGTSYTGVLADANTTILFTNAGAITFTLPPNASVAYPIGTLIEFIQMGGGAVTPAQGAGVTLNVRTGFSQTAGQYAVAAVRKVDTNVWVLTGDLT
jgi:hypothetical protein